MLKVRFLKKGVKVAEAAADTLKNARDCADKGFDHADKGVVVRVKPDGTTQYVEVRDIPDQDDQAERTG